MDTTVEKLNIRELIDQGERMLDEKRYPEAVGWFANAISQCPSNVHLIYCKGVSHHLNQEIYEAIIYYTKALEIKRDFIEAFENLAEAQVSLKIYDDALLCINEAIKINPKKALNFANKAKILILQNKFDQAIVEATKAIKIDNKIANYYCCRSNAYREINKIKESVKDLRKSIALEPNDPIYKFNLSSDLLLLGKYQEGWKYYEARFDLQSNIHFENNKIRTTKQKWTGKETLLNKKLLILPEQGFGDQIQFTRYAIEASKHAKKVIMLVKPELIKILRNTYEEDIVILSIGENNEEVQEADFYCSLMSLPMILSEKINKIPNIKKYLKPSYGSNIFWNNKINKNTINIGICWNGSAKHVNDAKRSIEIEYLEELFNINIKWHIIHQKISKKEEDLIKNHKNVIYWSEQLLDFDLTAGLINQLDLVITVDTAIAHLSASMGKETWVMLAYAPDFRWMLNKNTTLWYRDVLLFRQSEPRNWSKLINSIEKKLRDRYEDRKY